MDRTLGFLAWNHLMCTITSIYQRQAATFKYLNIFDIYNSISYLNLIKNDIEEAITQKLLYLIIAVKPLGRKCVNYIATKTKYQAKK